MTLDDHNGEIIVVRDDAIRYYRSSGRGPSYAYEGPKQSIRLFRDYLAIVSLPRSPSSVKTNDRRKFGVAPTEDMFNTSNFALLDTDLKFLAHTQTLPAQVRSIFSEWGDLFVLTLDGKVSALENQLT